VNIIVVTDSGIDTYKKWADMKKHHTLEKTEFVQYGADFIAQMDNESYEVSKDIKLLERVASEKVFQKTKMSGTDMFAVLSGVMSVLIYFSI
jgi:Ni,Fe-hydrogenase III large subunit